MKNYDKLYKRVDQVFAGTPNTPSALAIKSEILENLTAKYDDLMESGLSEEEAIAQVVDSIGDIDELFGGETSADPMNESTDSKGTPISAYPSDKVEKGRAFQRTMIAIAVMFYVLSITPTVLFSFLGAAMLGVSVMFGMWGLATAMIVGSGARLPWNNSRGKALLALGVGCYLWAFIPMFLLESVHEGIAVSAMFAGWALATLLIIFSTNFKRRGLPTKEGKRIVIEHEKPGKLPSELEGVYKPISVLLTMVTLVIYLGISFWTFGWAYTWLIWVIHGCVCDIVKAICWLFYNARRDV